MESRIRCITGKTLLHENYLFDLPGPIGCCGFRTAKKRVREKRATESGCCKKTSSEDRCGKKRSSEGGSAQSSPGPDACPVQEQADTKSSGAKILPGEAGGGFYEEELRKALIRVSGVYIPVAIKG
jgi:hypothetical protein